MVRDQNKISRLDLANFFLSEFMQTKLYFVIHSNIVYIFWLFCFILCFSDDGLVEEAPGRDHSRTYNIKKKIRIKINLFKYSRVTLQKARKLNKHVNFPQTFLNKSSIGKQKKFASLYIPNFKAFFLPVQLIFNIFENWFHIIFELTDSIRVF